VAVIRLFLAICAGALACDGQVEPKSAARCPQPHCPEILYDRSQSGGPRRGVEVDETDIYWCELTAAEGNVVRAAPKDGSGPVRTLGKWYDFAFGRSLIVDDRHVYWLRPEDTGSLLRMDKDGGNPMTIPLPGDTAGRRFDIGPLGDTADAVLVATHGCTHVMRVPNDGSAISLWRMSPYPNAGVTTGLESFDGLIYCANGPYIHTLDPDTGSVTEIVSGQVRVGPMAMTSGLLYFVNNSRVANTSENLAVLREGSVVQDLGPTFGFVDQLEYDSARRALYWVTGLHWAVAEVVVYHLDGAVYPQLIFPAQDVMGSSASDTDYLYWLSEHAVTRLKKWP
jgi:hypothetical protein